MNAANEAEWLPTGSVTMLYARSRGGDVGAACLLIERLSPIVHDYCRRRFGRNASSVQSGADFANEAMVCFHGLLTQEKLELGWNRSNLVGFAIGIAWKKQLQHHRSERTLKRGAGRVVPVSSLNAADARELREASGESEPQQLELHCQELLDALPEDLCLIAIRRYQGFSLRDIASELECHASTVKRKLNVIRAKWNEFMHSNS